MIHAHEEQTFTINLHQNHVNGLFEVIVEAEHGQKIDVHEKDEWREDLVEGDVTEIIHGIKLSFPVDDMISNIPTRPERVRRQSISVDDKV